MGIKQVKIGKSSSRKEGIISNEKRHVVWSNEHKLMIKEVRHGANRIVTVECGREGR